MMEVRPQDNWRSESPIRRQEVVRINGARKRTRVKSVFDCRAIDLRLSRRPDRRRSDAPRELVSLETSGKRGTHQKRVDK